MVIMSRKAASWTIDENILSWIGGKLGSKSEFVNRILKNAMLDEIISDAKKEQLPRCTSCSQQMRSMDGVEWVCTYVHCGVV